MGVEVLDRKGHDRVKEVDPDSHEQLLLHAAHQQFANIHEQGLHQDDCEDCARERKDHPEAPFLPLHLVQRKDMVEELEWDLDEDLLTRADLRTDGLQNVEEPGDQKGARRIRKAHDGDGEESADDAPPVDEEIPKEAEEGAGRGHAMPT